MSTSLCSFNIRGLGNKTKRDQMFHWLKQKSYSICLLVETHLNVKDENLWKTEWGGSCFSSGESSSKAGVSILINPNLNYDIVHYIDIIPGRLQALDLVINDKTVTILNMYGPNKDGLIVFNDLLTYLNANTDKSVIIGGGFNTVIDINLDKKNGRHDTHKNCRQKINSIIELHDLVDTWRLQHPDKLQFTWHSNTKPSIY